MTTNANRALIDWIADSCTPESVVLDVGAGYDGNGFDVALKPRVSYLVGIDPSDGIHRNRFLDERHQTSLEQFSLTASQRFDVTWAAWVLEHVTDPSGFLNAASRLTKTGGEFFSVTHNLLHYFGLATKTAATLGFEDRLLTLLIGAESCAEYHFPTAYRVNTIRSLEQHLLNAGFRSVEFRCVDNPGDYYYVVPDWLRWFPRAYSRTLYKLDVRNLMGRILFRAVK